ncbi:unnamed protein product [Vicia faba]|uniref:Uncharacterized protein n=1 Tax=Vicia faba TaxID=3906 RepID=A0AAV0ZCX1_VICFA|nr:unnamed protein product [Vicia faba]
MHLTALPLLRALPRVITLLLLPSPFKKEKENEESGCETVNPSETETVSPSTESPSTDNVNPSTEPVVTLQQDSIVYYDYSIVIILFLCLHEIDCDS